MIALLFPILYQLTMHNIYIDIILLHTRNTLEVSPYTPYYSIAGYESPVMDEDVGTSPTTQPATHHLQFDSQLKPFKSPKQTVMVTF